MNGLMLAGGPAGSGSLEAWRDLIEARCGTYFPESRFHILRSRLDEGMRQARAGSPGQYFDMVAGRRDQSAWPVLLDKLINRETDFFRHQATFDCLARPILADMIAKARPGEPVRIWSAGCASGEEAYSIAMTVLESGVNPGAVRILGLDLCPAAIEAARAGRYRASAMRRVPDELRRRYFRPEDGGQLFVAGMRLRSMVEFQVCNFVSPGAGPASLADVIVCQNVLIYFRPPVRNGIVSWLASRLRPEGLLLPGPGERADCAGLSTVRVGGAFALCRTAS